jgi:nucleoside-diphosphate-sugar epimerase
MARILVTGGAGFIGSALVKRLLTENHIVTTLDDYSRGDGHRLDAWPMSGELTKLTGDIRDRACVKDAVGDVDIIFHLAYVGATQTFYDNPKMVWDIAVNGIANVLDACEKYGDKELFLVSSSEAYQIQPEGMTPTPESVPLSVPDVTNPRSSYGGGKIISELGAMAYSMSGILKRAVIIRPHNIYGPDMGMDHVIPQFALRMKALGEPSEFPIQGTGQESRTFCYIDDLIDAFMILLEKGEDRNVYHVGTTEEVTISELAHRVAGWFGREIDVVPGQVPSGGQAPRRCPDISKMRALGFEPSVTLSEGLEPTLRWYAN